MGKDNKKVKVNDSKISKPRNSGNKFNGGTGLEFNVFVPKFMAYMESLCCKELIEGEGPENYFSAPRPCPEGEEEFFVQNNVENQKAAITAACKLNVMIVRRSTMSLAEKEKKNVDLKVNMRNELTRVVNSQVNATQSLNAQIANWEKQREVFLKKKGACIQAFYECFGSAPLATCAKFLKKGEVRAAWNCLLESYNSGVGGQQNIANIMKMLNNFNFAGYGSISEGVEAIRDLSDQFSKGGNSHGIPDELLLEMFLGGIEKSGNHSFDDIISDIRKESPTFEKAMQLFYERESTMLVKKQSDASFKNDSKSETPSSEDLYSMICMLANGKFKKFGKKSGKEVAKSAADPKTGKQSVLMCTACNKQGHTADRCWSKQTCNTCKQIGHIARFCPTNKKGQFKVSNYTAAK